MVKVKTGHQRGTGLPRDSHLGFDLEAELRSLAAEPKPSEASVEEAKAAPDLLAAADRLRDVAEDFAVVVRAWQEKRGGRAPLIVNSALRSIEHELAAYDAARRGGS